MMGNVKRAAATSIANDALELVHASDQERSLSALTLTLTHP